MNKKSIITVTKKHLDIKFFNGSGGGGQNRNKNANCVHLTHILSGIHNSCQKYKSRQQNLKEAFKKLCNDKKFIKWLKYESAKQIGLIELIEEEVDRMMNPKNIKIEVFSKKENKWITVQ